MTASLSEFAELSAHYQHPAVYILASKQNGTLYIGVTSDLPGRAYQHRNGVVEGFFKRYGVVHLVYFEVHETMTDAILRERQMKKWNRAWKIG
ncbi:MAG: GIY-YIG nuclease family protein [Hyphomicrobiales bacterium]